MKPETNRAAIIRIAVKKLTQLPPPGCYYWSALWWFLHSKESMNPAEPLQWSKNQLRLFKDMLARPDHYKGKPQSKTDYEWSQE